MREWAMLVLGLALGGALGWLWTTLRTRKILSSHRIEAEGAERKIKAAESVAHELRNKIDELQRVLEKSRQEITNLQEQVRTENEQKVATQTELKQIHQSLEALSSLNLGEQKRLLEDARAKLLNTFDALSAGALKSKNQAFLDLAKGTFETIQAQAKGDLETRQAAIDTLVVPLKEALERYERQIQEMEKTPQTAYGSLDEQLRDLTEANQRLQEETESKAAASLESRVLPSAGKLRDTGVAAGEEIDEIIEGNTLVRLRQLWPLLESRVLPSARKLRDPGGAAGEEAAEIIEGDTLVRLRQLWPLLSRGRKWLDK
jgi:chromosome segregation ATPase